jgi:hypothetical protein
MSSPRKKKRKAIKGQRPSAARIKAFKEKYQAHFEKLGDALELYEGEHPDWQDECLYWLADYSLHRLREFIESKDECEISWSSPFVELKFPVECRWFEEDGEPKFSVNTGKITEKDLASKEGALKSLTRLMVRQIEITTLQTVTSYAAYSQKGRRYTPMLGQDAVGYLQSLKSAKERGDAISSLLQPYSTGGGSITFPTDIQPGDTIPESVAIQLSKIKPPLLTVPLKLEKIGDVQVFVIFEVHPLIVNFAKKEAHYPLVIGLSVFTNSSLKAPLPTPPWLCFGKLSKAEQRKLWDSIFETTSARFAQFWPKKRDQLEEAIIDVNLRIRIRKGESVTLGELPAETLRQLVQAGEIIQLDIRNERQASKPLGPEFTAMLKKVESAKTAAEKGTALEHLMIELFSTIRGFRLDSRSKTKTEELDIFIENGSDEPGLRTEGNVILVECKNCSTKCSKDDYVVFYQKMVNRRQRCTLGFLVSWNGFAKTIPLEALRTSRDEPLVILLDGRQIAAAIKQGDFLDLVLKARREAIRS